MCKIKKNLFIQKFEISNSNILIIGVLFRMNELKTLNILVSHSNPLFLSFTIKDENENPDFFFIKT
jgi:hypothetical protein